MLLVIGTTVVLSIHPYTATAITAVIAVAGFVIGSAYAISHRESSIVIKTVCAAISMYASVKLMATLWGVEDMSYLTIGDCSESQYRFYGYVVSDILSAMFLLNANNVLIDPHGASPANVPSEYALYGIYPTTILSILAMIGFIMATTPYAPVYSSVACVVSLSICVNVIFQLLYVKVLRFNTYVNCFISISIFASIASLLKLTTRFFDHISGHMTHPVNMIGVADIVGGVDVVESIVLLSISVYMLISITRLINGYAHEHFIQR